MRRRTKAYSSKKTVPVSLISLVMKTVTGTARPRHITTVGSRATESHQGLQAWGECSGLRGACALEDGEREKEEEKGVEGRRQQDEEIMAEEEKGEDEKGGVAEKEEIKQKAKKKRKKKKKNRTRTRIRTRKITRRRR